MGFIERLHIFAPEPGTNLDKNGSENSYYALIATGAANGCESFNHVAAHEFGHLLGAGHTKTPSTGGAYLFNDSHAYVNWIFYSDPVIGSFTYGNQTIIAERIPPGCVTGTTPCFIEDVFSSVSGQADNQRTLSTTAKSVANYRVTNPGGGSSEPPGCSLSAPDFVTGHVINMCNENYYTVHNVSWFGGCPSQVTHYEIWKKQPLTANYVFGWTETGNSTTAYIIGRDGRIKIKACDGSQCSGLSIESYLITNQC